MNTTNLMGPHHPATQAALKMPVPPLALTTGSADLALLGLVADVRAAAGDPLGRLMQDELVERIRSISAALVRLHQAVAARMSADDPTGEQRRELLKAWEEAGRLIVPNAEGETRRTSAPNSP